MELHDKIRHLYYTLNKSGRQIANELGISRQTVAKALANPIVPTYTLSKPRPSPQLGPFKPRIEELLLENKRLPRKQRYTAHKIFQLLQKDGYSGSESSVQNHLVQLRKDQHRPQTFLPLEFDPGQEAQVDWGVAQAVVAGVRQDVQIFVMRLNFSRRSFVMAFPSQKQEAFFEGHIRAFQHFGGVPRRLSYDNLATAVKILVEGRIREEQRAFVAFRSYYLFDSHFCTPGQGHEKGGVEHSVGFSRRNFMVPVPQVASFETLNHYLLEQCLGDDVRIVHGQKESIGQLWAQELPYLRALPARQFECCVTKEARLTPYSQVIFETNRYSVPAEKAKKELVIKAYPFRLDILDQTSLIATHQRCYAQNQDIFDPLHYLSLLEYRPGAFEHAKPLRRWKEGWPPSYHRLLFLLKEKWPEGRGIQEFVRILKLHQQHPTQLVEEAVGLALEFGCVHFDGVSQCLHQLQEPIRVTSPLDLSDKPELQLIGQQPVDLARYNNLLVAHAGGR